MYWFYLGSELTKLAHYFNYYEKGRGASCLSKKSCDGRENEADRRGTDATLPLPPDLKTTPNTDGKIATKNVNFIQIPQESLNIWKNLEESGRIWKNLEESGRILPRIPERNEQ